MIRIIFALLVLLNFAFSLELLRLSEFKDQNVSGWLASEKFDGVRAYWDGENLLSRQGKKLNAPLSFTKNFPKFALDGELYAKELKFERIFTSFSLVWRIWLTHNCPLATICDDIFSKF